MRLIKKLDIFVMKAYLQLFAGTFFICLFIFLMQFIWRYVDELVGKGLSTVVLAKFMWYSALTLVPVSMPLAVLLASLISFGNLGERFELLSMKAAGIPLIRILMPILIFALGACGCSFWFQNSISPQATKDLSALLNSMRMKSPELEIPEGIFYSEIPGYNLYVERKDAETGMLYGVMIYTTKGGYDDAEIVLADSARLQSTESHTHLKLTLYNGERFRNMDSNSGNMLRATIPYMRESFIMEEDLISFDTNLNMMDAGLFSHDARAKGLSEMLESLDSMVVMRDSMGQSIYGVMMSYHLTRALPAGIADSMKIVRSAETQPPLDSIYAQMDASQRANVWKFAASKADMTNSEFDFRALSTNDANYQIRHHRMEANKKFTLSLACLFFFFIGAPLGAIIRKGGLGIPVIISVVIFVIYYMINASGENNAKVGSWDVIFGAWLSSSILLPTGIFLIYKANKDSVVFSMEGYRNFFMALLGLRATRKLNRKEVIINDPDYAACKQKLLSLSAACREYATRHRLKLMPSYLRIFFRYREDTEVARISDEMESLIAELHNSRDNVVIARINEFPIMNPDAHTRPFHSAALNRWVGILLPLGMLLWLRIWRYRIRLSRDMDKIQELCPVIAERLEKQIQANEIYQAQYEQQS